MSSKLAWLGACVGMVLAGCGAAPAEDVASDAQELALCRKDAPRLPDRTGTAPPLVSSSSVEVAVTLPYPPGNVAVGTGGELFVSMFPDTNHGPIKVGVVGPAGELAPFPSAAFQSELRTVLGIRADAQGRLWVLDHGKMALHRPRLFAFDAASGSKLLEISFDRRVAPFGSMLNDVVIAPDGKTAYVSDPSLVFDRPAIIVVDLSGGAPRARRVLERHPSVMPGAYDVVVGEKKAKIAGILCANAGVDGIALDPTGEYLYYAALDGGVVHRVRTSALRDPALAPPALSAAVEKYADSTMTDGMITDHLGNVYLTDMEHSAIVRVLPDRSTELVARDPRLRWPDGFAWAPGGDLYVTASALHETLGDVILTKREVRERGPYHVLRLRMP